jgi:hypothetical protein
MGVGRLSVRSPRAGDTKELQSSARVADEAGNGRLIPIVTHHLSYEIIGPPPICKSPANI